MSTKPSRVIVKREESSECSLPVTKIHHQHFPESQTEGASIAEGTERLAQQLSRAREGVDDPWHRRKVDEALADVADFRDSLDDSGEGVGCGSARRGVPP